MYYYEEGGLVSICIASSSACPFCPFGVCSLRNCSRNSLFFRRVLRGRTDFLALTCCVSFAITISCSFTPRLLPTILSASLRASWNARRSWTA